MSGGKRFSKESELIPTPRLEFVMKCNCLGKSGLPVSAGFCFYDANMITFVLLTFGLLEIGV